MEKYKEAIEDFSKTIELNPKNSDPYFERGNCLIKLEKYKEAIEDFIKSNTLQKEKEKEFQSKLEESEKKFKNEIFELKRDLELEREIFETNDLGGSEMPF